jgi:hypothetical protein
MKNIQITLQPLSLLVGAALLVVTLITTGAFAPQGSASQRDVHFTQSARTWVRVDAAPGGAETLYVVPPGKVFTLTYVMTPHCSGAGSYVSLKKSDGTGFWGIGEGYNNGYYGRDQAITGDSLVLQPGEIVGVRNCNGNAFAVGYLTDA